MLDHTYTAHDVNLAQTFLKPLVISDQISEEACKGMLGTLRLVLKRGLASETGELLTIKEACLLLKCSRPTFYEMVSRGKLKPVYLTGKSVRIAKSSIVEMAEGVANA